MKTKWGVPCKLLFVSGWILLLTLVVVGCTCLPFEPGGSLTINNRYDYDVTVYATDMYGGSVGPTKNFGTIPAKSSAKTTGGFGFTSPSERYRIEIKDAQGRVVFTTEMNLDDFEKMNREITIGP